MSNKLTSMIFRKPEGFYKLSNLFALLFFVVYKKLKSIWLVDYKKKLHYRVAVHESGHALLYYLLFNKAPFYATNKYICDNTLGIVSCPKIVECVEDCENFIAVSYAGSVAEELILGSSDCIGSGYDKDLAVKYCNEISKRQNKYRNVHDYNFNESEKLEKMYDKAMMLLEVNQDILLNLADYISEHRFILGHHIKDIIDGKEPVITGYDNLCIWSHFFLCPKF